MLLAAYALLLGFWACSSVVLLPVWVNLLTQTACISYIGAHRSLPMLNKKLAGGAVGGDDDAEAPMTAKEAAQFPLYGSAMLFSLYVAFKYFDKDMINLLLAFYFSAIGAYTLTMLFDKAIFARVMGTNADSKRYGYEVDAPYVGTLGGKLTASELVSAVPAVALSAAYFKSKHWMLNNLLGIAFSVSGIEQISLGSYKTGAILLVGLFFYDIFWVFGTEVMVSVAKGVDGPIKLLFPRSFKQVRPRPSPPASAVARKILSFVFETRR